MGSHHHHHSDSHGHSHDHIGADTNRRSLAIAAILTGLFMIAEVIGGLVSGSLALLADAGHMFTDFAALSMASLAAIIAGRPADKDYSFGYDRVAILIAFVNGLSLFLVAAWIVWEAVHRVSAPTEILAGPMLWVAIGGLLVNLAVFKILLGANQENLNIRGAVLHVLGDLLGSVAAIIAAIVIMVWGWIVIDPLLSVFVALLILRSAAFLVRDSARVLLSGSPRNIDMDGLKAALLSGDSGLASIDTLYLWSVTSERVILALRGQHKADVSEANLRAAIESQIASTYHHIDEVFLDVRCENAVD